MIRIVTFLILCGHALLAFAAAKETAPADKLAPLELPVPASALTETSRQWLGVYLDGVKFGWGEDSTAPAVLDGKPCVESRMVLHAEVKALGNVTKMEFTFRTCFSTEAPYRALLIEEVANMGDQQRKVALRHKQGTAYTATITEAGQTRTEKVRDLDLRLSHKISPELWAADSARKPGDKAVAVEFNSDEMKATPSTCTILRAADWAAPGGKLAVWEVEILDHAHQLKMTARVSRADGAAVTATVGQIFEVREEPEKVAKRPADGEQPDVFIALSIEADKKLGSSVALTELEIELTPPAGKDIPKLPDTVNQTVKRAADGRSLTVKVSRGKSPPRPTTTVERSENLKATQSYPLENVKLRALADKAVKGATDDREKVQKLLAFTERYMTDALDGEALTVMDILARPRGDCSAHSLLFTALARAAGIPAREAYGWIYMGDEYKSFGGHAWNEVILDGHWVPVDPTWNQFQIDAGHIQQHVGDRVGPMIEGMVSGMKARVLSSKTK